MSYKVRIDSFEGPFDLLLYLVSRQKVDIGAISITQIADQYLAEVSRMDNLDLDVASDFLLVASTLLEIKAESLLPRERDAVAEEVHVRAIHQRIQNKKTLRFSELVDERTPVPVVVVTFLAVLELYKRAMVKIEQAELFGDIDIRYIEGSGELVLTGDDSLTSVEEG